MMHNLCLETFKLKNIPLEALVLYDQQSQAIFLRNLSEKMSLNLQKKAEEERNTIKSKIDRNYNKTMTNFKQEEFPELVEKMR